MRGGGGGGGGGRVRLVVTPYALHDGVSAELVESVSVYRGGYVG